MKKKDAKAVETKVAPAILKQGKFEMHKLENLCPSETNPRKIFNELDLRDLTASIRDKGVLQPLVVRTYPIAKDRGPCITYEIVCGERRSRAAAMAGLKEVPVIVMDLTDQQVIEIQVIENLQRTDLTAIEEARGYKELHEKYKYSWEDLAIKIGKSKAYIYSRLKLLALTPKFQKWLASGELKPSWAEQIVKLEDPKDQAELEEGFADYLNGCGNYEDLDGFKEEISEKLLYLKSSPFNIKDADLVPAAGACSACAKNTAAQRDLFGDEDNKDRCTDKKCWDKKKSAQTDKLVKKYKAEGKTILQGAEAESAIEKMPKMDDKDYNHLSGYGSMTWRSALKDTKYNPVLAIDEDGQLQQLVSVSDAIKFVPKAKLAKGKSEAGKKERWAKIKEKQFERRVIKETNLRAGKAAKERFMKSKLINKDSLDFVFDAVISNLNQFNLELALRRCGYFEKDTENSDETMAKLREKGPMLKKAELLCEILLQGEEAPDNEYGYGWDDWKEDPFGNGGSYYLFLSRLGVDWNVIKKQVIANLKAADAEKN
jgi:ParB/RepB/Spo0J family partition protein